MKRIFGGVMLAYKDGQLYYRPILVVHDSIDSAIGFGYRSAKDEFPTSHGFTNHTCELVELPKELFNQYFTRKNK